MIGIKKQISIKMILLISSGLVVLGSSFFWPTLKVTPHSAGTVNRLNQPALTILQDDHPLLSSLCDPVAQMTPELEQLINNMFALLKNRKQGALAANQVGVLKQIFIIKLPDSSGRLKHDTFINPQITHFSKTTSVAQERCLSLPGVVKTIKRPYQITVQAMDQEFKPFTLHAEGLLARVIQHEMDHLQGVLITDRAK